MCGGLGKGCSLRRYCSASCANPSLGFKNIVSTAFTIARSVSSIAYRPRT